MSSYSKFSDFELIEKLKSGDSAALTEIHCRYYVVLYTQAYKRFPYREEIRDILQELFTYMWDNHQHLNFGNGIGPYLYTAVRNRLLKLHRHRKVRGQYAASLQGFMDQGEDSTYEQVQEKELMALIAREIEALPPQMRLIFELSRNEELSHKEIAEKLNLSPHTVRTQVRSSLRVLRAKLGDNLFFLFF
ncbi:RNA polymerase sigma factor [Pedobacter sp.]|uniref:RNA polymerase sigma factor n=1 Tax=Pedobacter sp. TaxID=1411316 RepID=UPI003D7F5F50